MSDDPTTTNDAKTTKLAVAPKKPCPGKPENFILTPQGGWAHRCWGKRRDTQERCKRPAAHGTKYCRRHGAMVPKGPAHYNYKAGTSRKDQWLAKLKPQTQATYLAALNDPDLLNCEAEIAALGVRLGEIVERIDAGHADPLALEAAFDMLEHGIKSDNTAMMKGGLTQLRELIKGDAANARSWQSFASFAEKKQRLIESERKRAIEANLYLTREQAQAFGHALLQSVARHVQDKAAVVRIVEDISVIAASLHGEAGTHEVG